MPSVTPHPPGTAVPGVEGGGGCVEEGVRALLVWREVGGGDGDELGS